ncbi:phosphoethanolamine transferase [Candidatus Trichorickettsia mobilis]|uniref:phosphoethanolamine transferase n=1 Tax=Candidatus Trichorickettsia mobilis TaxID=1346319 RepID=UPI0029318E87|nr:phosphoethanolamine transferase [Candidatus Trichorickettsia mobilis]
MFKILQKHLEFSLIKIAAIIAIIYMLLFNSAVFIYKFDYYKVSGILAIIELSKDFIYIYLTLFIFFFGCAIHRTLFLITTILLFISGALSSYYLYFFKIAPTKEIIKALFGTNLNEAFELASTNLIVWLVFSISICIYTIKHFGINTSKLFITKLLAAICLLLTINSIISPPYKVLGSYFPIQYLHNTYLYFTEMWRTSTRNDISQQFSFIDNSASDIVGVLVIGESARYSNFGINGYNRETTPKLKTVNNLLSFKAHSCSNITYLSVPCLLSRHSSLDPGQALEETGLLSILTHLKFNTTWIGTQSLMKYLNNTHLGTVYDEVGFAIIPGGSALFAMNDHDGVMLPYIENILNNSGKQFLVVHTSGSHWSYANRYPAEFNYFKPGCNVSGKVDQSSCGHEGLINTYDNSILYTDFFLFNLIELLKNKNALLIYAADHAEQLGENGRYGHGGDITSEQTEIAFIIWTSDQFTKNYPEFTTAIKAHRAQEISHDYVFHSVLDCLGIHSEIIDQKLSLCK